MQTMEATLDATPAPRKVVRALIVLALLFIRQMLVSWFFVKPFLMRINGRPCERERHAALPVAPWGKLVRLKFLWLLKAWSSAPESNWSRSLDRRHARVMGEIEDWVEARYPECEEVALPEYDWQNGNPEEFYERYIKTPMPVVLRGYALQTDAARSWNFDSVVEKCGEIEVTLTGPESDWAGPLKSVVDPSVYCANADAPFKAFPEMVDELSIPSLQPYIKRNYTFSQFFVGQKATGSGYHCAGIWNFFYMIDGQKKWWFVDPELSWMMYPSISIGVLAFSSLVFFPDRSDASVYRLYKRCPRYAVTLNPGDVLLNPPWWWHAIDNLTPKSVAVATRWDAVRRDPAFYELNRILSLVAVLNPSFPKFLYEFITGSDGNDTAGLLSQGAQQFDEDVRFGPAKPARNQNGRLKNAYVATVMEKLKAKAKW